MKKLLLILTFVSLGLVSVNAQEVGQWWVGGSLSVRSSKVSGGDRLTNAKIMPEFGYALSNRVGVGAEIGYAHIEEFYADTHYFGKNRINAFRIAPFARIAIIGGDFGGLFVDAGAGYTYGKSDEDYDNDKLHMFEVGVRPGISVNLSKSLSLIGKIGFLGYEHTKQGDTKKNDFGIDFHMDQLQFGAIFKF